ncbi:MAG: hypothetical protein K0R17_729 [Rariglobus sp.]|jgi:hypothetical protein|nr:hypothetical protein [Rariglobus sp.]
MNSHFTAQRFAWHRAFRPLSFFAFLTVLLLSTTLPAQVMSDLRIPATTGIQLKNEDMSTAALDKAQDTGAGLVRKAIYWENIETSPGIYNWSQPDGWIASMEARGFTMLITLVWNNRIYENLHDRAIVTEAGRQAFANFAADVAERYAGKDIIYEIWNEPNLRSFWHDNPENVSNTDAMAEEYTELVLDAVPAMKAADPGCRVVAGSISALWSASFSWFERCVEVGILNSGIDGISVHPYGFRWPELAYLNGYPTIRQIMNNNGGQNLAIVTSEVGYPESWLIERGFTTANVEQGQAWQFVRQNLVDAMAGIQGTIWYELTDASYGVLETNLAERPTFTAAQVMTSQLNGYSYVQRVTLASNLDYAAIFENAAGQRKLVAWTTPDPTLPTNQRLEAPHPVSLPVGAAGSYAVVDTFGAVTTLTTANSNLTVTIGGGPVYIPLPAVQPVEIIIDNTDTQAVTLTGSWTASTSTSGFYGINYLTDGGTGKGTKSVRFRATAPSAGEYEVYLRWTAAANRPINVPVDVTTSSGVDALTVNQRLTGGQWVLLGAYMATANSNIDVLISNAGTSGYVIADAVRIVKTNTPPPQPLDVVVDNTDPQGVTLTGSWTGSTADTGYIGTNYIHDGNTGKGTKSVRFRTTVASAGNYDVFLRWTAAANRPTNVPVDVTTSGGVDAISVNQRLNGSQWVLLGTYAASANSNIDVLISTTGTSGYVIADAIRVMSTGN